MTSLVARKLKNGSSGGPSGWTGELVFALMDDPDCVQGLGTLIGDMLNGHLPDQARAYLTCSVLIPVSKPGGGIRPIAVSEVFYRLTSLYALHLVRDLLPKIFEPIQLGVGSVGGSERAVHLLKAGLATMGSDAVVLKCDFQNAFNERKRSKSCPICLTKTHCSQFGGCHTGPIRPLRSSLFSITGRSVRQSALSKESNKAMVWGRSCSRCRCREYIGSPLAMFNASDAWQWLMI